MTDDTTVSRQEESFKTFLKCDHLYSWFQGVLHNSRERFEVTFIEEKLRIISVLFLWTLNLYIRQGKYFWVGQSVHCARLSTMLVQMPVCRRTSGVRAPALPSSSHHLPVGRCSQSVGDYVSKLCPFVCSIRTCFRCARGLFIISLTCVAANEVWPTLSLFPCT